MSIVELMRRMRELGAPPEAIELAVEAIEAEQKKDAERRAKRAAQKAKERAAKSEKGSDSRATVARHGGDSRNDLPSDGSPQENITQPPSLPPHSSDADASAQPAGRASDVSINDQIWNSKAALADLSGKSEEAVGRWIGKALKDHPPDVVKQGIDAALLAGTRDPFSYARSVMLNSRGAKNAQQSTRNGRTYPAARPEGTAARVAALMGYEPEPEVHGSEEERRLPDRDAWPKGRHASGFLDAEPDAAGVYRA
ncbi:MAG TPA: hypothetical protein VEZ24_09445 [Microvirga sp.]|nr:hypothetical protein [Microvirga sp.]